VNRAITLTTPCSVACPIGHGLKDDKQDMASPFIYSFVQVPDRLLVRASDTLATPRQNATGFSLLSLIGIARRRESLGGLALRLLARKGESVARNYIIERSKESRDICKLMS